MARGYLAVPASRCAVEWEFSISGQIAMWQQNHLSPDRICASMIYKGMLKRASTWYNQVCLEEHIGEDMALVLMDSDDINGKIPPEWRDNWWKERVHKIG